MTKRSREEEAEARKRRKEDTSAPNLRNRLYRTFGERLRTKAGDLPDPRSLLASCMLRLLAMLTRGETEQQRIRTVTIGLDTILHDSGAEGATAQDMQNRFKAVSDHVSRLRVNASLLANHICMKALQDQLPLPVADKKFYSSCLSACRSGSGGGAEVREAFQIFSDATGIQLLSSMPGTSTLIAEEATKMATAASNYIELNFNARRKTLLSWALRRSLRPLVQLSKTVFDRRTARLAAALEEGSVNVPGEVARLGFAAGLPMVLTLQTLLVGDLSTDSLKLRQLLHLQQTYLAQDYDTYLAACNAAHAAFPGEENKQARSAMIAATWTFYMTPPSVASPLPVCHNTATFIRLSKKSVLELFPVLKPQIEPGDPFWWRHIMNPFSKKANIPCLRSGNNRFAASEAGMFELLRKAQAGELVEAPWMIAPSFETDGVQMKLQLMTSDHDHPGKSRSRCNTFLNCVRAKSTHFSFYCFSHDRCSGTDQTSQKGLQFCEYNRLSTRRPVRPGPWRVQAEACTL